MIPFTQFMRPDSRQVGQFFDPEDEEVDTLAQELVDAGCRFEAEMLYPMPMVHLECVNYNVDEDNELFSLAQDLVPNGPEICTAIVSLVQVAHKRMFGESHPWYT